MRAVQHSAVTLISAISILATHAAAKDPLFACSDATKAGTVHVSVESPPAAKATLDIPIAGPMSAAQKRTAIVQWFQQNQPQYNVQATGDASFVMKRNFLSSTTITFSAGDTGEGMDQVAAANTQQGSTAFTGLFDPFDVNHQPAIFTAGIVTNVGLLTVQVSSAELNFQTDGPIICQALFQRLAPRAPQYGAQINYAGDRLEVYFDPAYTVTQGGIIFGTTSPSNGSSGTLLLPIDPPDLNPPVVIGAESIRTHGTAGTFSIPLGIAPAVGEVECRLGGPRLIEVMFDRPVLPADGVLNANGPGAEVLIDSNPPVPIEIVSMSLVGSGVRIEMIGVPNRSCLHLHLSGLAADLGGAAGALMAPVMLQQRYILGDTNGSGKVTSADIGQTISRVGQPLNDTNFRSDVNANGLLSSLDVNWIKAVTNGVSVGCP